MDAGFETFREARYPMDFTQRQAGGKFTRDEADEFIGANTSCKAATRAERGDALRQILNVRLVRRFG